MSLTTIGIELNEIISECLWAPQGDPSEAEHAEAAACYKALHALGMGVKGDGDVAHVLSGNNVYGVNFLQ